MKETFNVCLYNFRRKKKEAKPTKLSGSAGSAGSARFSETQTQMESERVCEDGQDPSEQDLMIKGYLGFGIP